MTLYTITRQHRVWTVRKKSPSHNQWTQSRPSWITLWQLPNWHVPSPSSNPPLTPAPTPNSQTFELLSYRNAIFESENVNSDRSFNISLILWFSNLFLRNSELNRNDLPLKSSEIPLRELLSLVNQEMRYATHFIPLYSLNKPMWSFPSLHGKEKSYWK